MVESSEMPGSRLPTDHSGTDAAGLPRGVRWMILAGGPAVSLATSLVGPILPSIETDLARGPGDAFLVKMLVGVMGMAMVIGAAVTGFLTDRFGLRRVITANYLLYAISGTAGVYLDDLHLLVASRFLLGIAASGAVTGSIIVINAQVPFERRASWLGYYNAVAQLGAVALNPVSGILGEFDWHWSFALYGLAAPFAVVAALCLQSRLPRSAGQSSGPVSLLRWFPVRFAGLGLLLGIVIYVPAVYLPFLLRDLGMTSPAQISLVLTGDIVAGTVSASLYGRARRRLSERVAFAVSFGLAGGGLLVAAAAPDVTFVVVGSIVFGIGVAWFFPNLMLAVAERVGPDRQGRAAGLVKGATYMGSPVAVFVTEPVARDHGAAGAVLVAAILSVLLLAVFALGRRLRTTRHEENGENAARAEIPGTAR